MSYSYPLSGPNGKCRAVSAHKHWSLLQWLFSLGDCRLNDVSLLWQCCPTLQTVGDDDSGCKVLAGLVRAMALNPFINI